MHSPYIMGRVPATVYACRIVDSYSIQAVNKPYSGLIVCRYSMCRYSIHEKGCGQLAELGQNLSKNTLISIVKSL